MQDNDNDKGRGALAQLVRDMRDNIAAHIEFNQLQARITRAKFAALVKEGFTEAQALQLCK
jgi:hypothetical protein